MNLIDSFPLPNVVVEIVPQKVVVVVVVLVAVAVAVGIGIGLGVADVIVQNGVEISFENVFGNILRVGLAHTKADKH